MTLVATLKTGAPPSWFGNAKGRIYGVNGIDYPFAFDGIAGWRNWGILGTPAAPAVAVGAAGGPTGAYLYRVTWFNDKTGEYGIPSANSATLTLANQKGTITRPSIVGIDAQVTHWRVWRTLAGATSVWYKVADVLIATGSYTDADLDSTISLNETLEDNHYPPSPMFRYAVHSKGRNLLYGSRVESTGTVTMAASPNVVGAGTQFTPGMVGQKFYVSGDSRTYTIASWTDATHIALTETFTGTIGAGKVYKVFAAEPCGCAWGLVTSEAFDPNDVDRVFPNDGDFPTGMNVIGSSVYLWKYAHCYQWEFGVDPNPSTVAVIQSVLVGRGLISEKCCIMVGSVAVVVDALGVYMFDGASATPIDQKIRRYFHPDSTVAAEDRVNRAYANTWHGGYDPKTNSVSIFLTCGTESHPQTEFVYHFDDQNWTINRRPMEMTASANMLDSTGEYRLVVMDNGTVGPWAYSGTRQLDGTTHGTIAGTATAGGASTLTDGTAAFYTTGNALKGMPISIISGTNAGDTRLIASNTGTVITTSTPWATPPAAGSVYRIGAVDARFRSVWHTFQPQSRQQMQRAVVYFEPRTAGPVVWVRFFKDFEANPILEWQQEARQNGLEIPYSARTDGYVKVYPEEAGGRVDIVLPLNALAAFSIEFRTFDANSPATIRGYDLVGSPLPSRERAE